MIGYKLFNVTIDDNVPYLTSPVYGATWDKPVMGEPVESLMPKKQLDWRYDDGITDLDVTVGYHAITDDQTVLDHLFDYSDVCILTKVSGYGKVRNHEKGFRSEYMQILEMSKPFCLCGEVANSFIHPSYKSSEEAYIIARCVGCLNDDVLYSDETWRPVAQYSVNHFWPKMLTRYECDEFDLNKFRPFVDYADSFKEFLYGPRTGN